MADSADRAAALMSWCSQEFAGFFAHVGEAIRGFQATGRLPPAAYDAGGHATPAAPRKNGSAKKEKKDKADKVRSWVARCGS